MSGLFIFLLLGSMLAGLYFLVRLIMSFIKKDDRRKKHGKYLGVCVALFLVIFIGLCVTDEIDDVLFGIGYAFGYLSQSISNRIDVLFK